MVEKKFLKIAVENLENGFLCKNGDCPGIWTIEPEENITLYKCAICNETNCVPCEVSFYM